MPPISRVGRNNAGLKSQTCKSVEVVHMFDVHAILDGKEKPNKGSFQKIFWEWMGMDPNLLLQTVRG